MEIPSIRLTKKRLETIGSHSLLGLLLTNNIIPQHKNFIIEFEVRSMDWCRKHNGPDFILIPEYVPICLMKDVISLTKDGYNIQFKEVEVDN